MNGRGFLALGTACLLAGIPLISSCGHSGGGGDGIPPGPPPPLNATPVSPINLQTDVSRTTVIYVAFDRPADPITITTAPTPSPTMTVAQGLNPALNASVSYDAVHQRAQLQTSAALGQNTTYTVTLTNGIKDTYGIALAPLSYTFTTIDSADIDPPIFSGGVTNIAAAPSTSPPGAGANNVDLTWDQATDPGGTAQGSILYDIYVAYSPSSFDFFSPPFLTVTGTGSTTVNGIGSYTLVYFTVRARDTAGNFDTNTEQASTITWASFQWNVYPIIYDKCRSCHIPLAPPPPGWVAIPGMHFGSVWYAYDGYPTYTGLFSNGAEVNCTVTSGSTPAGAKRVKKGNSGLSFLYNKCTTSPWAGAREPQPVPPAAFVPLTGAEMSIIQDWIDHGGEFN